MTKVLGLIKKRKICYEFSSKKVSKKDLYTIIQAGQYAPSSHNCQDWKFIIIRNPMTIQKIMADCTYGLFHTNPPVIIALIAEPIYQEKKGLLKKKLLDKAQYHKYINIGFAADHMMLTAESLNIDSAILSTTIKTTNATLKVPSNCETLLCLALGYAQDKAFFAKKERKKLSEIVSYEKYTHHSEGNL